MVRRNPVQRSGNAMRRMPIQERRGARVVRPYPLPPPVGGWNARDALQSMSREDAVRLRNFFPRQSDVVTRPGFTEHCATGATTSNIRQLIPFEYATNNKLIASTTTGIYDVTTSTPSTLATGLVGGDWSFDYLGGLVLLANGTDVVKSYNGSAISSPAFTGVTLSNLTHVCVYKSRAYFVEKNTQKMWYGGVSAVSGALTAFDFSQIAGVRGNLLFTSHLKGDGGDGGADDVFVAMFQGGSALVYTGSNPGDSTNWSLIGHYRLGRPLGRLAYHRADDDLYVATNRGYMKFSEIVRFGDTAPERMMSSNKIQQAVTDDITKVGESLDWRMIVYPKQQMFIVTSPLSGSARRYHVRNINTGAWCEFGDFLAYSWATLQGRIYFGGSGGKVYEFDSGLTDDGITIRCDCQQAWSSMGAAGMTKQTQLIKPFLSGLAEPSMSVNVGADYAAIPLANFSSPDGAAEGSAWNDAVWDGGTWSYGDVAFARWYSRNAVGESIGLRITMDAPEAQVRWNQTIILATYGGPL